MGAVGPGKHVCSAGLTGQEVLEPWTPSETIPHSSSDLEHPFRLHPSVLSQIASVTSAVGLTQVHWDAPSFWAPILTSIRLLPWDMNPSH